MPTGQPNYLTVDAAGNIGADFTGHVRAAGLDLIAGDNTSPPNDRKIIWHRNSYTGALTAEVYSWADDDSNSFIVNAPSSDAATAASIVGTAYNVASGNEQATLTLGVGGGGASSGLVELHADPSGASLSTRLADDLGNLQFGPILRADGVSRFLKLATTADRKVSFGTGSLAFVNQQVKSGTFSHGLGVTPLVVLATSTWTVSSGMDFTTTTYNATSFVATGSFMFGNTTGTVTFAWIAIG